MYKRFRTSEWILVAYCLYVAVAAMAFPLPTDTIARAWLVLAGEVAIIAILARPAFHYARDWVPLLLLLTAYRQMDWFSAAYKPRRLEQQWQAWDRRFLYEAGFQRWIEIGGPALPWLLEFAYLLVYGIGAFSLAAFYFGHQRRRIDQFLTVYLAGTLIAYALFPYYPSDPPRVVFPGIDFPHYITVMRRLNLALVGGYGIHSSVFPSAHVSSAFSAAWGLLRFLPEYRWAGWTMLCYAIVVSVATVYGRYHYGADAVAGFAVSLVGLVLAVRIRVD